MKTLILFYSRTGTTKKIAEKLATTLSADLEEIFDTVNRSGAGGYLMAGRDATLKKLTKIKPLTHRLADYDLVIIGTPIWSWTMSTPIRTLLTEQKNNIKQTAFFCTQGGSGAKGTMENMAKLLEKQPIATLDLTTKNVIQDKFADALDNFVTKINI